MPPAAQAQCFAAGKDKNFKMLLPVLGYLPAADVLHGLT
jgi:hypothetical protein